MYRLSFFLYCRYSYAFPFLDTKGIVVVDDDRVGPLYEHTFPPSLAPSLSFIGIPRKVITSHLFLDNYLNGRNQTSKFEIDGTNSLCPF